MTPCLLPLQSAVGHEYQSKLSKHCSQVDSVRGFGGKFGVQVDRVDQVSDLLGARARGAGTASCRSAFAASVHVGLLASRGPAQVPLTLGLQGGGPA